MNNLAEYRKRVEALARARTGEAIANGSYDHAAIIVEQMFKCAKSQVSILSGNLNARVYGRDEVLEQAKLFLAHGEHKCRILLEVEDPTVFQDHPFFEALGNNANLELGYVSPSVRDAYKYHFLVMDDDSYRFEPEKDEPVAVAAFGERKGAANLARIFEILWNGSAKVDLQAKTARVPVSA